MSTVLLLAAGGMDRRGVAVVGNPNAGDPLPQAFALTAVVITFGITVVICGDVDAGVESAGPAVGFRRGSVGSGHPLPPHRSGSVRGSAVPIVRGRLRQLAGSRGVRSPSVIL